MSETVALKYKLAARVLYRDCQGQQFFGRVVDASRDHVTVTLSTGRTVRVEGNDIALCISRPSRQQSRRAPRFF